MIKNAKSFPIIMYGRHMSAGVAEYREPGKEPLRILVNENTIRDMNPTFAGKPIYVHHVDEVDLANLQAEADGFVIESFYNSADACHWAKMILISDKAKTAVLNNRWRLSNAYMPKNYGPGGMSKGVEYQKEVMAAEFEHLAIVDDPRYEDSIILSPEQFLAHNNERIISLNKIANANIVKPKEKHSMFEFFKKSKVEASTDLDETLVKLSDGREVSITQLINEADMMKKPSDKEAPEEKKAQAKPEGEQGKKPEMCNEEHHVAMKNGETMSVKDLKDRHDKMQDCMNTMSEMASKKDEKVPEKEADAPKPAEEKPAEMVAKNEDDLAAAGVTVNTKNFETLKNAEVTATQTSTEARNPPGSGLRLGNQRYGSGK